MAYIYNTLAPPRERILRIHTDHAPKNGILEDISIFIVGRQPFRAVIEVAKHPEECITREDGAAQHLDWLAPIMDFARHCGCSWVMFDSQGDIHLGQFPVFYSTAKTESYAAKHYTQILKMSDYDEQEHNLKGKWRAEVSLGSTLQSYEEWAAPKRKIKERSYQVLGRFTIVRRQRVTAGSWGEVLQILEKNPHLMGFNVPPNPEGCTHVSFKVSYKHEG
jgi:hypothetical protein